MRIERNSASDGSFSSRAATMAVAIAFELGADVESLAEIRRRAEAMSIGNDVPGESELWRRIEPAVSAWNKIWLECVESGGDYFAIAQAEVPTVCSDDEVARAFLKVHPLIQPLAD